LKIESVDGAAVDIQPVRYQFPDVVGGGTVRDWDANWLVIRGACRTANGQAWAFEDPCLTTWEASSLATWLIEVVAGTVPPSPFDGGDDERLTIFTEPNLAFSLQARDTTTATLRVHFSLEALPPWEQGEERTEMFEYYVPLQATLDDVSRAAADWESELAAFPER
jgi:hypothetical protein